jgi:hypothetical protein
VSQETCNLAESAPASPLGGVKNLGEGLILLPESALVADSDADSTPAFG